MGWKRLTGPFREFGFGTGLLYVVARVLAAGSPNVGLHAYDIVAQPVSDEEPKLLHYVELRRNAHELDSMPPSAAVKQARFDQGAIALAVYRQDRYIGYVWLSFDRYDEDEVRCTYELPRSPKAAFDFDVYVFPEYRMGRAFAAVWQAANTFLRAHGVRQSYSRISRFNLASLRAHTRLGARRVGRATFLRVGCLQLMVATPRRIELSWTDAQRPVLQVAP